MTRPHAAPGSRSQARSSLGLLFALVVAAALVYGGHSLVTGRAGPAPATQPQEPPKATAPPAAAQLPVRAASPFTIERVLEQLRKDYPDVARVDETRPPGVEAVEDVTYATHGGVVLALDVYRPAGRGPFPAVLIVHGGGWESGSRQMERPLARALAARGYAAMPVSYRLGAAGGFPAAVHDLKAAVRWARANAARRFLDPERIAIAGGSAGGHLAALVGASNGVAALEGDGAHREVSSAVQAVVNIDGAASFPDAALIAQEAQSQGATSRFLGGNYAVRRATWFEASPLTWVGPASAPTLFVNSTATRPILPGREEMRARLNALGVTSDIVVLPNTPHPFWLVHPWFEQVVEQIDQFFRRTLRQQPATAIDWRLDNLSSIGGHAVTVAGSPRVVDTPVGRVVEFDGVDDGIFLEVNPLAGMARFTVEVLFEPAADGPAEQRFLHVEEAGGGKRALVETRLLPSGRWCLDTFLKDGDAALTLIDRERTHPVGQWHVAALVYDGARMSHYVDGALELSGTVAFRPLGAGRTSIGVRLNRVYWFKGRIAWIHITPEALAPGQLRRAPAGHSAGR